MKRKALLSRLLASLLLGLSLLLAACGAPKNANTIDIALSKDRFLFEDQAISYTIVNHYDGFIDCSGFGDLERKNGDQWDAVPSTKPNPVAWCGTMSLLNPGENACSIPYLNYNGTLAEGTYRITFSYTIRETHQSYTLHTDEFALAGGFPMTEGYPPPANVYLSLDASSVSRDMPELSYRIINESGGELYLCPRITLMLCQDEAWTPFLYETGADGEITSAEAEITRMIDAEKLPGGFKDNSAIRIIEEIAIPIRNVFYASYEVGLD